MIDPKTIILAIVAGVIPALLWLWFWLREDREHPEPKGLLLITFFLGVIAVLFVLPIEKFLGSILETSLR